MTASPQNRRGFLGSTCKHCLGLGALLLPQIPAFAQPAAAAPPASLLPARFTRPGPETDEGGLWSLMDREETRLRRSSSAIRDPALAKYLSNLTCRLAGDHCVDVRVHAVRTPLFNASMAPNGMMQVWSGLLLRVENEAQLAAVVAHEMAHYLERHTLERLRSTKDRAAFAQFLGLFGLVGAIGQLGVLASLFSISREQESRADQLGMQLMQRAGYDGRQAAQIWDNLLGELKIKGGEDAGKRSLMMATHPPTENRRDDLLKLAGEVPGVLAAGEFQAIVTPHRLGWLEDEMRRGQYEESLVLFDRMLASQPQDAQVLYARGEVLRLRAGKNDLERSLGDLLQATALQPAPAEAFRALGLVHRQRSDAASAVQAFDKYLALWPEAPDAGLIKTFISELKP